MRFEIRTGGLIGILIGLALLSGAVFVLGLLAGYDVGRQSEVDGAQIATAYPLPPPSNATPSPIATSPPAASTSPSALSENNPASSSTPSSPNSPLPGYASPRTANAVGGIGESSIPPSPLHPRASSSEASRERPVPSPISTPRRAEANATPVAPTPRAASTPTRAVAAVNPPPAPRPRRKPYNIQIEAAMDRQGADAMVQRLEQLGYQPHLVPTQIDGATWFKVEIGPYATEEEAETAQDELRVRYNRAFGVGGAQNPAR